MFNIYASSQFLNFLSAKCPREKEILVQIHPTQAIIAIVQRFNLRVTALAQNTMLLIAQIKLSGFVNKIGGLF